jgi:hypothetical protein
MTRLSDALFSRDSRIGAALAEYERRVNKGEQIDHWAFVSEYEDIAEDLISHFETVNLFTAVVTPRSCNSAESDDHARRHRLGDYQVLEEIGRGGMGVVTKARQSRTYRWHQGKKASLIVTGERKRCRRGRNSRYPLRAVGGSSLGRPTEGHGGAWHC